VIEVQIEVQNSNACGGWGRGSACLADSWHARLIHRTHDLHTEPEKPVSARRSILASTHQDDTHRRAWLQLLDLRSAHERRRLRGNVGGREEVSLVTLTPWTALRENHESVPQVVSSPNPNPPSPPHSGSNVPIILHCRSSRRHLQSVLGHSVCSSQPAHCKLTLGEHRHQLSTNCTSFQWRGWVACLLDSHTSAATAQQLQINYQQPPPRRSPGLRNVTSPTPLPLIFANPRSRLSTTRLSQLPKRK
jgi:hypothetical protein